MLRSLTIAASIVLGMTATANAYCSEPTKPWSKPSKPNVPFCVNKWDNTHTCDDWEIDHYNRAIRTYNSEVEDYIRALRRYVDEAVEYAQCEIKTLDD